MTHLSPLLIVRVSTIPFEALAPLASDRARRATEAWLGERDDRAAEAERISVLLHGAAGEAAPPGLASARGAVLAARRAIHQDRDLDARVTREAGPLLSAELRARMDQHRERAPEVSRARRELSAVYAEETARAGEALVERLRDPLFHLGLRLAGRALAGRADSLARLGSSPRDQRGRHTASKLLAYLGRFTTKTSPNGVFCATALGAWTDGPAALRGESHLERLEFLIHVGDARKVTACLAVSEETHAITIPRVNPTLRREGGLWTLWRPASPRRPSDDEVRTQIKDHPVLQMFLEAAAQGRCAEEVVREVETRAGRDVRAFYAQLVDRGVLIAEVEIPWSERRPLRALASRCGGAPWAEELDAIEREVDGLSGLPLGEVESRMDDVAARLERLPHTRPLSRDDLLRCDASSRLGVSLPRALLSDLERLVPRYARFYGAIYPEALFRESFADRFLKSYPADTDVPVLDFYHGLFDSLGAARPAGFLSPRSGRSDSALRGQAGAAFERARDFFTRRARETPEDEDEVELTERDWSEIAGDTPVPTYSCGVLFQVAARSVEALSGPEARLCLNAFFPGAGLSIARLAHLHGAPIVRQLRDGWARQARPGAGQAEISFMHGGRTANAGLRPPLFQLEIELPGDKATEGHDAIPLADLTARWDSAARRFVVRSRSRGIDVLPVISSGISPEGIISFLTMVGSQGIQPLGFFPGFEVPEIRRWPRFRFGNVVLFRRRWVFRPEEMPVSASPEEHYVATQQWRREHRLPLHVFVHTERETKPFYVDLGSVAWVDLFRRALVPGDHAAVHVTEMLPGPEDLWVRDTQGRFASEFLVHLDNLER